MAGERADDREIEEARALRLTAEELEYLSAALAAGRRVESVGRDDAMLLEDERVEVMRDAG